MEKSSAMNLPAETSEHSTNTRKVTGLIHVTCAHNHTFCHSYEFEVDADWQNENERKMKTIFENMAKEDISVSDVKNMGMCGIRINNSLTSIQFDEKISAVAIHAENLIYYSCNTDIKKEAMLTDETGVSIYSAMSIWVYLHKHHDIVKTIEVEAVSIEVKNKTWLIRKIEDKSYSEPFFWLIAKSQDAPNWRAIGLIERFKQENNWFL